MLGFCFAAPMAQADDLTLFGLKLNAPLTLPECHKTQYMRGHWEYDNIVVKQTCISTIVISSGAIDLSHAMILITFSPGENPSIARGSITGYVEKGNLVGVRLWTHGSITQDYDFQQLVDKFGLPAKKSITPMTNRFGAKIDIISADWDKAPLTVEFSASDGTIDRGVIEILLPEAKVIVKERQARLNALIGKPL